MVILVDYLSFCYITQQFIDINLVLLVIGGQLKLIESEL